MLLKAGLATGCDGGGMAEIAAFLAGFERFREQYFNSGDKSVFERLRQGQNPRALVISCCD
jgi:carbonic anhydrase